LIPLIAAEGIGSRLLKESLQILQNEETIKLDATPAGREVYLKFDFVDEYRLSRMVITPHAERLNVSTARAVQKNDLPALVEFDREIFGADRQTILQWMLEGAPQYSFLFEIENKIQGYCLGRIGHNFTHIGPVIAKNTGIAINLISAVLKNCIGKPVILDVLHFNQEWIEWLTSIGFAEQRPFIRMYRGHNKFCGIPEKQFAILGPEYG